MHSSKRNNSKQVKTKGNRNLNVINSDTAGIDIGADTHWVAVEEDRDDRAVRSFRCFTSDLHAMADWLAKCGIKSIAMESTGVYWIPVFQLLESRGFEVKLVNAKHVKNVPGRKTDVQDCQWLQKLHSYGLLSGSFRPDDQICVVRSYWRHRNNLVSCSSAHIQHMQKALTEMNLQLHRVLSDITGVSGMRIIRSILAGERDPNKLAAMADIRVKISREDIAKSLEGNYRQEHLFTLRQAVELYDLYQQKIRDCDFQIKQYLRQLDPKFKEDCEAQPRSKEKSRRKNEPYYDLRTHLHNLTGVDFTQITGFNTSTVQTIISEVGLNPHAFPNAKCFSSWLGLCPDNRITGGKIIKRSTRKVVNRAANAFRLAAQTLVNSSSALGGYCRRMRARHGAPKAITATAHKLACLFYKLWKTGEQYVDPGVDYYEQRYKERILKNMKRKAQILGYQVAFQPLMTGEI